MKYPLCYGTSYMYNLNEFTHSTLTIRNTTECGQTIPFIQSSLGHKTVLTRKDISVICFEQTFLIGNI